MSQHPSQPQPRPEAQIQSESEGPRQSEVHDPKDPYTLLCERCGYIIEGLPKEANCPECAKPIAESLPERRVGTAWQNDPGLRSLWVTAVATLFHPVKTVRTIRIEESSASTLRARYIWFAAAICAISALAGALIELMRGPGSTGDRDWNAVVHGLFLYSLLAGLAVFATLYILTTIEERGLRIIGRTRGFRIDRGISKSVCAHGSVGWLIASAGFAIGATLSLAHWIVGLASGLILVLAGFLFFETFAYLGLRHCKYANRPKPRAPDQSSGTA